MQEGKVYALLCIKKRKNEHTGEIERYSDISIFNNVQVLINYLPQIQTDEKNPNDCATEPHELTHICDALRYFCVSRTRKSEEAVDKVFVSFFNDSANIKFDYGEEIEII
jgi:hypothetical protein